MGLSEHSMRVNKILLPVKCHYFLFMAALACALPFRTVFAKQLGISATAVGIIFCAVPFLKIVANPLFGFVLDYFKRFRLTLSMLLILLIIFNIGMIFIPPIRKMPHYVVKISEENFHSKIKYSCISDKLAHGCDLSLLLHSEYNGTNKFGSGRNSFMCDILCPYSTNSVTDTYTLLQCSKNIRFEIKLIVDISNCDMYVSLESGKIHIVNESIKIPILVNKNESLNTQFKSWLVPAENCSRTESPLSDSEKNTTIVEMEPTLFNLLEEKYNATASNVTMHTSTTVTEISMDDNSDKQYYALQQYRFRIPSANSFTNDLCRKEFICRTTACYSKVQEELNLEKSTDYKNEFLSSQFWGLFFLITFSSAMLSAVIFIMDAICYEMLQEKMGKYGHQRLWGSVGWGFGALAGGYVNEIVTENSDEVNYAPSFYLLAILMLIDFVPLSKLKVTELKYSSHIWKDVCFLFSELSIVYNIVIVFFVGVLSGFIWNYQFWFMEEIGSSQVLLGLSQTAECIFELPWFLISGWIIKSIGYDHCNNITLFCFGLRYLCFAFIYDPWWTLAAGLFHGPTFGLFYASITMYAKNKAPPGTEATVQSLLHLSFEGIGVATGSILGGIGIDKLGSRTSFMCAAAMSFLLFFVNIIMGIMLSRIKRNSKQTSYSASCP